MMKEYIGNTCWNDLVDGELNNILCHRNENPPYGFEGVRKKVTGVFSFIYETICNREIQNINF